LAHCAVQPQVVEIPKMVNRALVSLLSFMSFARTAVSMAYNFGKASSRIPLVFGVEAPGVPMKPGGKYNEKESVPTEVVEQWADYLKEQGVSRTLCLLKQEELDCYANPGYASILESKGIKPSLVDVFQPEAGDKCWAAYQEAVESGEKIAVHCSGGEGRTGVVLGTLLAKDAGISSEDAASEILSTAEAEEVVRKVGAAKLDKLLNDNTLA